MLVQDFAVDSPNVRVEGDRIISEYTYQHTDVERTEDGKWVVRPASTKYEFCTETRVPKLG